MDYKSVFTNLCLELQQNRSWIKGLGKNPQKSELIHWRQCLLSGGTEACSLGLRETPACIHVIQRLSQPRVVCWHGFRQNSQKMECVFTRCPTGGRKKNCMFKRPPKRRGFNNIAPIYISELLKVYTPSRNLRSSNMSLLKEPTSKRTWGDRFFSVAAPRLCNHLPTKLKSCHSKIRFKSLLKTHLMSQFFKDDVYL